MKEWPMTRALVAAECARRLANGTPAVEGDEDEVLVVGESSKAPKRKRAEDEEEEEEAGKAKATPADRHWKDMAVLREVE